MILLATTLGDGLKKQEWKGYQLKFSNAPGDSHSGCCGALIAKKWSIVGGTKLPCMLNKRELVIRMSHWNTTAAVTV